VKRTVKIALAFLVVGVGGCLYLNRGDIAVALMRRGAVNSIFRDTVKTLPDGLHVGFCGTGSPFPSPTRSGPCAAIIAGPQVYIVDVGRNAASIIARMGLPSERITAVLLTHFHSDHIDGLGQLGETHWLAGSAKEPLLVIGPTGVDRVVNGFNEAHALNGTYRIAFDGPVTAAPSGFGLVAQSFELAAGDTSTVVLDHDGLRITAFNVNHKLIGPAVGYRFDYKGRSIVVSGDTATSSNLVRVAAGADVLVHEGMSPRLVGVLEEEAQAAGRRGPADLFHNLQSYHARPSDAADEASAAKVRALIFTHLIPPIPAGALEGPFLDDARDHFSGPLSIAEDGDLVSLPADGGELTRRNLL
jgi:ribonuclease Z